jgi:hypothetical protein
MHKEAAGKYQETCSDAFIVKLFFFKLQNIIQKCKTESITKKYFFLFNLIPHSYGKQINPGSRKNLEKPTK